MIINNVFNCTYIAVVQDIPNQIWVETTGLAAGNLPIWLVRAFHNKPRYFITGMTQCYLHYLSPRFWWGAYGVIGLLICLGVFMLLFKLRKPWRYYVATVVLLFPLVMIFELYR